MVTETKPSGVQYKCLPHSSCSMIKEGTYPLNMSSADVEKEVQGTFGGKFERFQDGHFRYVAYTD